MNEHQRRLMCRPPIDLPSCPFCGRPCQSRHHIVPRSQGGTDGPTETVCGWDNVTGCHGLLHRHRLHLDWRDGGWWYLRTDEPTKEDAALLMGGWQRVEQGVGLWSGW